MSGFVRDWLHNLWVTFAVVIGVGIFMVIFMSIFYPDSLKLIFLSGQFAIGMINILKLWPLVILGIIIYALPRRRNRR